MSENRTSRGLIAEIEELSQNIMAIGDHLLDLRGDDLIESLDMVRSVNAIRQELISIYATEDKIDYRYHCPYKHSLKALGIYKEAIIAAKRSGNDLALSKLLTTYDIMNRNHNWIIAKYLKIDKQVSDPMNCSRCLDDLMFSPAEPSSDEEDLEGEVI